MTQAITWPADAGASPAAGGEADDALVAAARSDPDAFALLYGRYLPRVYRYVRARSGSPEDAADLTQQVFLNAFRSLHRYSANGFFAAWLFRIARNVTADASRRRPRMPEASLELTQFEAPDAALTEEQLIVRERHQRLRAIVASLDPHKRDLLALRFAAGLTSAEIARLLGKSEAAVKKQLTRTIDSLKEHYRDELT